MAAIRIRLLCAIINGETMTCDPTALIDASRCIESCIPAGLMPAVEIYLLCQIANNGTGGGSGGGIEVTCGVIDPVTPPTGACGIYYRTDTLSLWIYSGGWQAIVV